MGAGKQGRIKREIELQRLQTFARIEEAEDGGPIIDLITGREPHPVGATCCIKAGMRALTWESMTAERPMIELCEVASPVRAMMCQPHELFIKRVGGEETPSSARPRKRKARSEEQFRPDLILSADAAFVEDVVGGTPFSEAVANWKPGKGSSHLLNLVVEVKNPDDPRLGDPAYLRKVAMAEEVYEAINWHFVMIERTVDIDNASISCSVREIMLDHAVSLSPADIDVARSAFDGQRRSTLGEVAAKLGAHGVSRCSALHVRRIISIDLRHDLAPGTPVVLMPDDAAIFELSGAYPW
jgi:hypothetical protein